MRIPAQRIAAFGLFACAWWLAGCATAPSVNVVYDKSQDLSAVRTWDWIEGNAVLVRAPAHDAAVLESELSELVVRALAERGFDRVPGDGAVRVAALLVVYRTNQPFRRARAMQTLYSHHDTGNFEVQADEVELRPVDRMRLSIYITAPSQERMVWQGALEERHFDDISTHLDDAIGKLLEEFPPPPPSPGQQAAR